MDLFSIGEMVIDFIPGSEQGSYIRNAGGAPANVAIAVARNGLEAGMCCSVGEDDFGRFLMKTLQDCGVRALHPQLCSSAITTMAFVTLAPDGDRSFTFARKPGADMFLSEEDVKEEDIADAAIIHAGSCSLSASPALRLGREKNKLVSFDVNYRNLMWNDDQDACTAKVLEILPYVDLLKISEEEVEMMGGEKNLPALMERYGLTLVVETLGDDGARCFFKGKVLEIPGRHRRGGRLLGRLPLQPAHSGRGAGLPDHGGDSPPGHGVRQRGRLDLRTEQGRHSFSAHPAADRAISQLRRTAG